MHEADARMRCARVLLLVLCSVSVCAYPVCTNCIIPSTVEQLTVQPVKKMSGVVKLPGSKSLSNRILLLAALAEGTTLVKNLLVGGCVVSLHAVLDICARVVLLGGMWPLTQQVLQRSLRMPRWLQCSNHTVEQSQAEGARRRQVPRV
jgi:hypothetical protein